MRDHLSSKEEKREEEGDEKKRKFMYLNVHIHSSTQGSTSGGTLPTLRGEPAIAEFNHS